jgi:hypothetical protein
MDVRYAFPIKHASLVSRVHIAAVHDEAVVNIIWPLVRVSMEGAMDADVNNGDNDAADSPEEVAPRSPPQDVAVLNTSVEEDKEASLHLKPTYVTLDL